MKRWLILVLTVAVLTAILAMRVWNGPIFDPAKLATMKAEAHGLMQAHPTPASGDWVDVPSRNWPRVVASLRPERVQVARWGVVITTKSYFDGGWGYHIPRQRRDLPMPQECYSEPAADVFWHGPC